MKPADFFVGVLEFFAILLPGAILLGFLVQQSYFAPILSLFPLQTGTERYAGFLMAAYTLGHLVFLLASYMDGLVYHPLRKTLWKNRRGDAYDLAGQLRRQHVGGDDTSPMNTFKWSTAYLLQNKPAAAAEVRRFEADSKFFRSLSLLLAILCALLAYQGSTLLAVLSALLCIASVGRYAEQRYKCGDAAYRHVVVLCTRNPFRAKPAGKMSTKAGGDAAK